MRQYLEIGKIVTTHGLKGDFKVNIMCDSAGFASQFKVLYLKDGNGGFEPLNISACRPHGSNMALVKARECGSIDDAKKLVGKTLYFSRADASLEPGCYFDDDLIGLSVIDSGSGKPLGKLTAVYRTGANDVYGISDGGGEKLFPAVSRFIDLVDLENGEMRVSPPEGLFEDED